MRTPLFILLGIAVAALVFESARLVGNDYVFFAGYTVLQFVRARHRLEHPRRYTGYVNFAPRRSLRSAPIRPLFFHKTYPLPIPVLVVLGAPCRAGRARHGLT